MHSTVFYLPRRKDVGYQWQGSELRSQFFFFVVLVSFCFSFSSDLEATPLFERTMECVVFFYYSFCQTFGCSEPRTRSSVAVANFTFSRNQKKEYEALRRSRVSRTLRLMTDTSMDGVGFLLFFVSSVLLLVRNELFDRFRKLFIRATSHQKTKTKVN